ncbi:MAG: hypothetical protein JKY45_02585 [Emcibacter sp.]|nr:hypothetical protein [Emcibacter sp.]
MAFLILKILATLVLSALGLVMTWVVFVGTLMSHETTKFKHTDYVTVAIIPLLVALIMLAMWG